MSTSANRLFRSRSGNRCEDTNHTATLLEGVGLYNGNPCVVIYSVVSDSELRQGDGDKVGAAAGHPHPQAQAAREAVDDPAKNADEQLVLRDGEGGDQVGEDAGHHNGQAGVQGEPLAHQLKADEGGHNVDAWNYILCGNVVMLLIAGALFGWEKALYSSQIDGAERQLHPAKLQGAPLDQAGNPGKAAGEQVAGSSACPGCGWWPLTRAG